MLMYELRRLAEINTGYQQITSKLKFDALSKPATAFISNMDRVVSLSLFPPRLIIFWHYFSRTWTQARDKITGDPDVRDEERYMRLLPQIAEEVLKYNPVDFLSKIDDFNDRRDRWENGLFMTDVMGECAGPYLTEALEAMLASMVVGTWTAFETLTHDLWISALNANPAALAELKGSPKRISARAGDKMRHDDKDEEDDDDSPESDDDKKVYLGAIHRLSKGTYNLNDRMGSLLCARFKFATLRGIREAYSSAFPDKPKERVEDLDAALADNGLDALHAVRNVIVHRAGIADDKYTQRSKNVPLAPRLEIGDKLPLKGSLCRELVDAGTHASYYLILAVEAWLQAGRK